MATSTIRLIFNYCKYNVGDNIYVPDHILWQCLDILDLELSKSLDDTNRTFILRGEMKWYESDLKERFKWLTDYKGDVDRLFNSILLILVY